MEAGRKLREAREQVGLSQRDLAARLKVSQVYVSNVERGTGVSAEQLRLFGSAIDAEAAKGGTDDDEGERKQRKRTPRR